MNVEYVYLAFLQSEWSKLPTSITGPFKSVVETPNLENSTENELRRRLLSSRRGPLLQRVPQETKWFEVCCLTSEHLDELLVIGRCGWDDPADHNELRKVAVRKRIMLQSPPPSWMPPILWGHDRSGPFTILEGNHRFVAYAAEEQAEPMNVLVYVGLSPSPCFWHLPDPPPF